jgi:hypothetical protein
MVSAGGGIRLCPFKWQGYTLKNKEEIPNKAPKWDPEGKRKPDRSKESWMRTTQAEAKKTFQQMGYIAKERQTDGNNS